MITPSAAYLAEHNKSSRTPIYQLAIKASTPPADAYWRFEESSGPRIDAFGSAHLTPINAPTRDTGHTNYAVALASASSQYLTLASPTANVLHHRNAFSVAFWVYLASKPGANMCIAAQFGVTTVTHSWMLYWDTSVDRFIFRIDSGAGDVVNVTASTFGAPATGTWYLVCGMFDPYRAGIAGTGTIGISVNAGTIDAGSPGIVQSAHLPAQPWNVGVSVVAAANYWNGRIDEGRFFKHSLSQIEIERLYAYDPTVSLYEFATAHPVTGEDNGDELLEVLRLERESDIEQCRCPLSTLTVRVNDIASVATAAVSGGLIGLICELNAGFYDIAWAGNALRLFTGIISEITYDSGAYVLTARSPMVSAQDKTIFNAASTQLTAAIDADDTTLAVVDTSAFAVPNADANLTYPIAIDEDFMFPRASTATGFSNVVRVPAPYHYALPPLLPNSQGTSHLSGSVVQEFVTLGQLTNLNHDSGSTNDLHPIDHLLTILTDINKKGIGVERIPINSAELAAVRTALGSTVKFIFIGNEPVSAKTFIEEEIYLACAMWPTENALGELGAKLFPTTTPVVFDDSMTDAHVVAFPKWLHNAEKLINQVIYYFDWNPLTRKYLSSYEYRDDTAIAFSGREMPLIIHSKGIRSQFTSENPAHFVYFGSTAAFLRSAAQRHIARFGVACPVIATETILSRNLLELADDVTLTFSQAINLDTGARQLTASPVELKAMRTDFRTNLIEMEFLSYPQS